MTNKFGFTNTFKAALGIAIALPLAVNAAPTLKVATSSTNYLTVALASTTSGGVTTYSTTIDTSHCTNCATTSSAGNLGSVAWSGTIGDFTITNAVGMTKPAIAQPALDLGIANVATGSVGGTLILSWSDTGFISGTPMANLNVQTSYVLPGTVAYTAYVDNTNALFGTGTLAGSIPASSGGNALVTGSGPAANTTFSMTEVETFVMGPNGAALTDDGFTVSLAGVAWACPAATGQLGTAFTSTSPTTGIPPYNATITTGSLPPGITLASNGIFSGTPTAGGTYPFTATVTDSESPMAGSATISCTITVPNVQVTPITLACPSIPAGTVGVPYSYSLMSTGGTSPNMYSILSGSLPTGTVTLNTTSGTISGTPSTAGTYAFVAKVTDSTKPTTLSATSNCSITIAPAAAPTVISCPNVTSGKQNTSFTSTITVTGGAAPYSIKLTSGTLPAGLALGATTTTATGASAVISGTPTSYGTSSLVFTVTDAAGKATTTTGCGNNCSITIAQATPLSVNCPKVNTGGAEGSTYNATVSATGGTAPYKFTLTSGSLPAGLTLNSTTGVISGTPTAYGTFNLVFTVTDASGKTTTTTGCGNNCSVIISPLKCQVSGKVHVQDGGWGGWGSWGDWNVSNHTVYVSGTDCFGNKVNVSCKTDNSGNYCVTDLNPGKYTVSSEQKCSYQSGWSWGSGSNQNTNGYNCQPDHGQKVSSCDFLYWADR